ncbi:F-box domain [Arabidopsis suecica]|uniref:F-box domain n=1 Tax=Arabidopsis suecica TaxID=45249 RepID=A0A8T1XUJ2_ARASU|nr:F-box domain [Arabidopsis suecica]
MVDRENSSQILCSKGFSQRLEEDRISQLPDPLICHILSHLLPKEAVTTSVLSTRWRTLWLWVPSLELVSRDFSNFNAFASLGDRFFESDRMSCLDKLNLTIAGTDASHITSWIDAAVKRKVQHLRFKCFLRSCVCRMPVSLYVCETLVSLKLESVILDDVEFVSFPRLKTLHLLRVILSKLSKDAAFERFISCCPVLEDLEISGCLNAPQPLRVHSRSLKRLIIGHGYSTQFDSVPGVVIDAPQLCFLRIIDHVSKSFIVNNLEYNAKLEVDITFGLRGSVEAIYISGGSLIRSFLSGILKVGDLTIHEVTLKIIYDYSKSESLPQFGYMSRLCVSLFAQYLTWLEPFLESCPNLKSLVLKLPYYLPKKMNQINFSSVPKCLQSSLEFVDLKFPVSGHVAEMKLVRYFLENSAALKKLTLHLDSNSTEDEILTKLLEIPRASTKCEVVIVKK